MLLMKKQIKVGLCFDFDDTLCEDSTTAFLEGIGFKGKEFWQSIQKEIEGGYDPVLAYMNRFILLARQNKYKIAFSREKMEQFGKSISFYPGVITFFKKLKAYAGTLPNPLSLHFFLISSGLEEIIQASSAASSFDGIFSSAFAWDPKKNIPLLPKRAVSFTDKTRFLFAISKGLSASAYFKNPMQVNYRLASQEYDIPFSRIIYVGDGFSDIPCFALLKKFGGFGIGVHKPHKPETALKLISDERVQYTASTDYRENGSITLLIRDYLRKISLALKE